MEISNSNLIKKSNDLTKNTNNVYIYIPIKSSKDPKKDPTNPINKYVNKYNSKNKYYYTTNYEKRMADYTYICNSDVYI